MLTFTRDRAVYWFDTLAGRIEPMQGHKLTEWGYIPDVLADSVPNVLRRQHYHRTQRDLKQFLARQVRGSKV